MVREVIWSLDAKRAKFEILEYWNERNKSKAYSKKLNHLFINSIKTIQSYPFAGKKTQIENVRLRVVRDYMIFYEINEKQIRILIIWDTRRDPDTMHEYLK